MLPESEIEPIEAPQDADALPEPGDAELRDVLDRAVVIKLNGGLGHVDGHGRGPSRCSRSRTAGPSSTSSPSRSWTCAGATARGCRSCS